ncbi:UNVERIFIED_ORG: transposase-like protein [Kosakonia oryzae]|uniref:Transposase, Mutator family n=1 Tax=Kosakonia radicincitans TaxID=283686 RepID=A0AAX2F0Q4_9ENTR|nr:transposase-like protein [Kosakonia oryzae]SFF45943.1 hypothetical protein SAMN03159468_05378 [Kosakonia radicincitans]SFR27749.1 hypothetical protein SAMN03159514_05384 [Kosakonia radicincitans]SFU19511.1 hypothetical protein SAMN03159428_05373 [Kosakonia radicincitans]SFY37481.1 hypothetical protein SAMN03159436_05364 [Kosakonia radicincitans]
MDDKKLKALIAERAKGLKTEADLNLFSRMLTKVTVETVLNAELTDHPEHEKMCPKQAQTPAMTTHKRRCCAIVSIPFNRTILFQRSSNILIRNRRQMSKET